ncbi:uncharacterized protein K452DRAFT_279964 [Aplosporella prunicola CBS 121167]|uniref:RTA1 like protein n=1 Tax=Aplosporella prunicola CBS 121167 TaxID=1176127 RepID=A0A6A6AZ57_9PEZI|nr:uncharacterized protein K452DRAFT_279964 [Aplosporella prunicola CBS 121167]KAF2136473.1 hypothetical protein K452DRAFT_279964 [Aplosporella prunicola CBS 121167]
MLYHYSPTVAGAVIFCILFLGSTGLHVYQMARTKTWYMTAFCIGSLLEFIGFAARAASGREKYGEWTLGPYIIQTLFILLAPAFLAASIYMILGRVILLTDGESHSLVKRRWLTKAFVTGDVLSFLLQGTGGGLMSSGSSNADAVNMAQNIVIGGLVVQLVFFGFFIIVSALFHRRMSLVPTARSQHPDIKWQQYLSSLYFISTLIMVRSIMRVIEYGQGFSGYIMTHEAFIYIFDALPMFVAVAWLNWKHPSAIGVLLRKFESSEGHLPLQQTVSTV